MIYLQEHTMSLTRSCMALATTPEVQAVGLFGRTIDWRGKGNSKSHVDILTGKVVHSSRCKRSRKYKPENHRKNKYLDYETMKAYFDGLDGDMVYRKPSVHCMVASLSDRHRELLFDAFDRDTTQSKRTGTEALVALHHIDCDAHNNMACNILPCTPKEHRAIHKALRVGASVYEALVAGLGEALVHEIFGTEYFDFGDGGIYTSAIFGESYIKRMIQQLSAAGLPADCDCIRVKTLQGKYECLSILRMSVWEILSVLYTFRAVEIKPYCSGTACIVID